MTTCWTISATKDPTHYRSGNTTHRTLKGAAREEIIARGQWRPL